MHKQLDVAESPRASASVYVHVPLFATLLMSVINFACRGFRLFVALGFPVHLYPCINNGCR